MFCGCKNDPHAAAPNTLICPICLAHPGTLPVANRDAIKSVLLFGVAVGGDLATYSEFDRKNYFYPDIPKAYQLSQAAFPFIKGGELDGVKLTRVHLEEDTARSQHDKGENSLVDFNRAGVPLMELVTEPVIHDAVTAGDFARELQLLLRTLGISDANMERGEMRVEANISVSNSGQLGTKVEVKNLNSFKSVEAAINFEINRQVGALEKGTSLHQETRGWDEVKQETYVQRSKETAKDYRYFPDPDLPKLQLGEIELFSTSRLVDIMPELPAVKRFKYSNLGLTDKLIQVILQDNFLTNWVDRLAVKITEPGTFTMAVNYLITDLSPQFTVREVDEDQLSVEHLTDLIKLVEAKKVTSRVAKDLLIEFANNDSDLVKVATDRALLSTLSEADLLVLIRTVITDQPAMVAEYRHGKVALLQFFLGQVMKQTRGAADPALLKSLFENELK